MDKKVIIFHCKCCDREAECLEDIVHKDYCRYPRSDNKEKLILEVLK